MIIDSLTHVTYDGKWFNTRHLAGIDQFLEHINRHEVKKSVVSGTLQPGVNDYILNLYQKYPDFIYPLPVMEGCTSNQIEPILLRFVERGARAVKIHPRWLGKSLEDPWVEHVLTKSQDLGLAIFICTVTTGLVTEQPVPKILRNICSRYKDLKIVLLHGGFTDLLKTAEEIRPFENAMLDLSFTLPRFYDSSIGLDMKYLMRTFDRRILIGTDFPEFSYDDVRKALDYLGISWGSAIQKGLLGGNFARFLLSNS